MLPQVQGCSWGNADSHRHVGPHSKTCCAAPCLMRRALGGTGTSSEALQPPYQRVLGTWIRCEREPCRLSCPLNARWRCGSRAGWLLPKLLLEKPRPLASRLNTTSRPLPGSQSPSPPPRNRAPTPGTESGEWTAKNSGKRGGAEVAGIGTTRELSRDSKCPAQVSLSHQTSPIKYKFKGKIIKNFKMATTER